MISRFVRSALLVVVLAGTTSAFAQTEAEPNGTIGQANGLLSANVTVTGNFAPGEAFDEDYYAFTLTEASMVTIRVWGPTVGVCAAGLDPTLTLFNSAGLQIAYNDDTQTLCPLLSAPTQAVMGSLPAGTYYVKAKPLNMLPTAQPYTLVITAGAIPEPISERFTYQGKLDAAGMPANGEANMVFSLWTHPTRSDAGSRLGQSVAHQTVTFIDGLFTVDLDFTIPNAPANYDGNERYLQIEVADFNGNGSRVVLEPRQRIAPTPHAIHAMRAASAANATQAVASTYATNANAAYSATYASIAQTAVSADTATHATTASVATSAESAASADIATYAESAGTVHWNNISGKPFEFSDNDDGTGGWSEDVSNDKTYTGRNVGIGTSSPGSFALAVVGTAAKTGGGSWSVFCDERLKHDIKPLAGTLDRLLQLRGYTFEYNASAVAERLALPGTQIGLMAQEVERVFPDWVAKDENGYRYVTERATTALMVEALRDLRSEKDREIEAIKARAAKSELENQELKARLERLEKAMNAAAAN